MDKQQTSTKQYAHIGLTAELTEIKAVLKTKVTIFGNTKYLVAYESTELDSYSCRIKRRFIETAWVSNVFTLNNN